MVPTVRCNCANATACNCALAAGDGIVISGQGSGSSPYRISATLGGLADTLVAQSTDTVTLTLVGEGTPAEPALLTADAEIALTQLTDVGVGETPTDGDVPLWVTDHWEFAPPPTAPAGAVTALHGLSGDGSGANPLQLLTPLEWGTGISGRPDLDYFGSDSTIGQPVYVDSAGNVRAQPSVIPAAAAYAANVTGFYPVGVSIMTLTSAFAAANGWPAGSATAVTFRRIGDTDTQTCLEQWWHKDSSTNPEVWYRQSWSGGINWGPWQVVVQDTGWIDIVISAGFTAQGTEKPQVRLKNGAVYSRGGWSGTGITVSANSDIGTVPAGYRPTQNVVWRAGTSTGAAVAELFIQSSGVVQVRMGPTSSYVMLGATWLTD